MTKHVFCFHFSGASSSGSEPLILTSKTESKEEGVGEGFYHLEMMGLIALYVEQ